MGRLRPWTLVFALVPACVGEDPPLPVCDVNTPFGKPEPLSELATSTSKEVDLVLLPSDENTAFFSTAREGTRSRDLFTARRPNRARPFENIAPVLGVNADSEQEYRPLLTPNGDTLYFTRVTTIDDKNKWTLFRSKKNGGTFGVPEQVVIRHKDREASPACPWIDQTGGLLYFTELDETNGPINYIWTIDSPDPPGHVPELDTFQCMVVSDDRSEAFVRKAEGNGAEKIFRTDHSQGSSWSPPKPVGEFEAPGSLNFVTYVTKNHCDAYIFSTRDGAERIYWARRAPSN